MSDLRENIIIITGAGSGIGAATAVECARAGMHCVLNDRREASLRETARRVEELGGRAAIVPGCVTEPTLNRLLLDTAERRFGRFDCVFANAGHGCDQTVLDTSMDELREMMEVHFFAAVELLRGAAARLIDAGRPGHLLVCSSTVAKVPFPMHGMYAAAKAAVSAMCAVMRSELAPHEIEVSGIHPIVTRTDFFREIARRKGRAPVGDEMPEYCPPFMVQPPERVARAVVRCLRKPRAEMWTSPMVRAFAALVALWPWPLEAVARRHVQREMAKGAGLTEQGAMPNGRGTPPESPAVVHAAAMRARR